MDETTRTRQTVLDYIDLAERRDWGRFGDLLTDDVVYEIPQTRERVRGREELVRFNEAYPGDWHLRTRRVVADGRHAAAWIDSRIGPDHQDACVWFELADDGRIGRITDFWPDPYEPPADRADLVERY